MVYPVPQAVGIHLVGQVVGPAKHVEPIDGPEYCVLKVFYRRMINKKKERYDVFEVDVIIGGRMARKAVSFIDHNDLVMVQGDIKRYQSEDWLKPCILATNIWPLISLRNMIEDDMVSKPKVLKNYNAYESAKETAVLTNYLEEKFNQNTEE